MDRIVFSFLGTNVDSASGEKRWESWRPTVSLFLHEEFKISEFHFIYDNRFSETAELVLRDIAAVSPQTKLLTHILGFNNPWDFEEVYEKLFDLCKSINFNPEQNEYLFHISTGTHVAQICIFLLTETRHFPGKLLQARPGQGNQASMPQKTGNYYVVDLDISRYDRIANRFHQEAVNDIAFLKSGIDTKNERFNILIEQIEQVAINSPKPILLTGATGTGKSRLARQIYALKKQRANLSGNYVELNCGTLRGDAAMSALFGHVKGAFTGAISDRKGFLTQANKGLIFLDEIGELGLDEQTLLLHAIEEKKFFPFGSDREIHSDFQIICGTNRDLIQAVKQGRFREDLLARINLWTFSLPNLKDRPEDILPNIEYELRQRERETGVHSTFNREALAFYLSFAQSPGALWNANFRDLNASIERMCTLAMGARINTTDVEVEVVRLQLSWGQTAAPQDSRSDAGNAAAQPAPSVLPEKLSAALESCDQFDRLQLEGVLAVCRNCETLAEAGRTLYAKSRLLKQGKANDTDRLKKYLAKFGLGWEDVEEPDL
ncbi:Fis family transcriptional regulator [Spirochaetia bacterium]|nr:Fis family transcriptional regulator [Spirochaetia bacterium]